MGKYGGIYKLFIIQIRIYFFFRFTDKVSGKKNEQSDVAKYGRISKLYIIQIRIYLLFRFNYKVRGTKTEQSDAARCSRRIHVNKYSRVRIKQSTVGTYGGILKLFIIYIIFYLFSVSLKKYEGRKLNNLMWLLMARQFMSKQIKITQIIIFWTEIQDYHFTRLV